MCLREKYIHYILGKFSSGVSYNAVGQKFNVNESTIHIKYVHINYVTETHIKKVMCSSLTKMF